MKILAFLTGMVSQAFSWLRSVSAPLHAGEPGPILDPVADPIHLRRTDLGSSKPERAVPPRGHAPEPASGKPLRPDRWEPEPAISRNPTLVLLRRRALNQLFDHFNLAMIPAEAWFALDRWDDPVTAFQWFAVRVGCEPERVRRRDAKQLARMQAAIDLLVNLHRIREHLSASGDERIQTALRSSDDAELSLQAHQIESLAAIHADRLRADGLRPCAAYDRFASIIDDLCRDPLGTAASEIDEASIISDRLLRAMHQYSDARAKIDDTEGEIARIWSTKGPSSEYELNVHDGILFRADELDTALENDGSLAVAEIEDLVSECAILLEDMSEIFKRYSSDADFDTPTDYIDEREAALKFFGFPSGSSPSEAEIKKTFREMWKLYNVDDPSHRATEKQRLENEQRLKEINKYSAVLRPKKSSKPD
jgi:hypothetical protein